MSRILVLEDDDGFRAVLSEVLTDAGYQAVLAQSGAEAIEQVKSQPFDLLLIDNRMPGISGFEFLQWARTAGYQTPVIIMTAYADVPAVVSSMRLGAMDFLTKPFSPIHSLLPVVERCLKVYPRASAGP
jgi:DNA-binding NtrC family response regulator